MTIFKIIILMIEFLGFSLLLNRYAKLPLSIAPPVIVSSIVLVLYLFGFFISLKPLSLVLHISGLLAFIVYFVLEIKNRQSFTSMIQENLKILIIFLAGLFIVLYLFSLNEHGEFRSWDEFSHWGTVIKAMYEANSFILNPNPLYCQDYPPGTALFSYHILSLLGYTEGNAYFSSNLLIMFSVAPIVLYGLSKNIIVGLTALLLVFYLIFALGNGWSSVLIDQILSVALAGSIVSYYLLQEKQRSLFYISIMLAALVLYKHAGASLALFVALVCVMDWMIVRFTSNQSIMPHWRGVSVSTADVLWLLSLFLLPFLISFSWKHYVVANELRQTWGQLSISNFFIKSLSCCTTPREIDVTGHFFAYFLNLEAQYVKPLSIGGYAVEALGRASLSKLLFNSPGFVVGKVVLVLGSLGLFASFFFPTAQKRLRYVLLNCALIVGALLYSGSLLLAYLYGFSDYEAKILTSFLRYHNVFLLAWALIIIYMVIDLLGEMNRTWKRMLLFVFLAAFSYWSLVSLNEEVSHFRTFGAWSASEQRIEVSKFVNKVKPLIPQNAKVYIDWYGSNGWEFWMAKYELMPRITNLLCFSLGPKLSPEDLYTCEFQTSELQGYDYLLIGRGLQILNKNYPEFFEGVPVNVDAGLLKVNHTSTGIKFDYVPD